MSRYIDIDEISLRKTIAVGGLSAKALWRRIQQAPHIDIVRCKECKHWKKIIGMVGECESDYMWSTLSGEITEVSSIDRNGDDFCSYGERKSDE